ncbi:MAG: ZIP family metal transporter [Myxococcales bacterium]|jgi:ZIP family zinc transporter
MEAGTQLGTLASGLLGSLVAGLGTGVGALLIFVRAQWGRRAQTLMLSFAAGVMLGATAFSLVAPSLDLATAAFGETAGALTTAASVALGALGVWLIHAQVPHEHFERGPDGRATVDLGRNWLFILAITLHNFPEGMSVGVSYGGDASTSAAVTLGIGVQNLPEGLAVAAALLGDGFSRARAFAIALATGLVEPVGGLIGATAVSFSDELLPWGLGFAGGAMLFVISGEVIPETHREGDENVATFALVVGFLVMMLFDVLLA